MLYERINTLLTRKLSGEATETEIRELGSLIDQNPELETIVNTLISHWNKNHPSDQEFLEATYLLHLDRMKAKGVEFGSVEHLPESSESNFKRKKVFKNIAIAALPLLFLLFLLIRVTSPGSRTKSEQAITAGSNEISTRNGSRSKIQLPDGSVVWLNAGSKLEYDKSFGTVDRQVKLTGEAYFDVIKNPSRPFIVNTHSAKIKVLGTAFNVRSYPDDNKIETSLIRGSVEVTLNKRPDEKWILKPNEKLVLLNDYITPEKKENTVQKIHNEPVIAIKKLTYQPGESVAVEAAWAYNKLSFEDESFLEVANKMARWYDVSFIFKNKELENLMLHGSFTTETISQAMEALQYSFKFKYEIKDKVVTIY